MNSKQPANATIFVDGQWPQWRGVARDGHAVGSRLPKQLPPRLPEPSWRVELGIGYASPVAAGGIVIGLGRTEDGNEQAVAIDERSGKVRWTQRWKSDFVPPDPTAGKGPNATPVIDKDRVYVLGLGGMFHCLDLRSGRILWKHDLAAQYWGVSRGPAGDDWFPVCGCATSPLVLGDTIVLSVGGAKAGALAGFDRQNGKLRWSFLDDRSSYGSPVLIETGGVRQVVAPTGKRLVGFSPSDRKLLWELPMKAMYEQTILTPAFWRDIVLAGGEARPMEGLRLITDSRGGWEARSLWRNAEMSAYLATPVVFDRWATALDHRSRRLVTVDMETGKTVWTSPRIAKMFAVTTVAANRLLVLTDLGKLHVAAAVGDAWREEVVWDVPGEGPWWSQVAVLGDRLLIRDARGISAYRVG